MHIYVAYEKEWPYLPIAVGDTAQELADQIGIKESTVYTAVYKEWNHIKKVMIEE